MIVRIVRRRFPFAAALPALLAVGSAPALAADRTGGPGTQGVAEVMNPDIGQFGLLPDAAPVVLDIGEI